jgi:oligoendopeptidase F
MTYPTTRDLSTLYASDDDPSMVSDTQEFVRRIDTFVSTRDQPTHDRSDPEVLARALADYEPLRADYLHGSRELAYRYLRDFTDSTDVTKARLSLAQTASSQQLVRLQFFELAIGGIDPEHHPFLLTHPALAQYQHRLERLWSQARYDLSPETEKALTLTSASAYGQRVAMTDDALNQTAVTMTVDGAERSCTLEELMTLLRHTDSSTRDTAAQHIHQIMSDHEYIATRELNAILEYKKSTDYLRGFDRPDGSRIVSEDVDPAVVDALLDAVTDAYDISRDYYVLKASVLGQDTLAYHERNIPIHLSDEPLPSYTYDQACDIFSQVCATMDDRFVGIRDDMRASGRVDVYPRTGKR